jgi:hypothetical protein
VSDSTIGIKVADGSYYPVLEHGFTGTKKLTLTTAKDNQQKVQIDLYSGVAPSPTSARYIGSLVIENIPPASQGKPEIELLIGIDDEGQLSAEACDNSTGECQKFDTSLGTLESDDTEQAPDFSAGEERPQEIDLEEPPLTGEAYPVGDTDRRKERLHKKGPNILLLVLFVVLGLFLVAAIAFFVYRSIRGPAIPLLSIAASSQPTATSQPAEQATPATTGTTEPAVTPTATDATPAGTGSVSYRIKKGDTLWDIASTYYRNPWLYPRLAKANSIRNPDLIFAGTRINIPEN